MHARKVSGKKRIIRKLKRKIREKEDENHNFDGDLEELALDVAERSRIDKSNSTLNTRSFYIFL